MPEPRFDYATEMKRLLDRDLIFSEAELKLFEEKYGTAVVAMQIATSCITKFESEWFRDALELNLAGVLSGSIDRDSVLGREARDSSVCCVFEDSSYGWNMTDRVKSAFIDDVLPLLHENSDEKFEFKETIQVVEKLGHVGLFVRISWKRRDDR